MNTIRVDICGGAREGKSALVARLGTVAAVEGKRFIVAESANDEQYTTNLRDGAPIADVSVIVVDARQGITAATRRHGFFASLLAVRQVDPGGQQDGPGRRCPGRLRPHRRHLAEAGRAARPAERHLRADLRRERRQRPRALGDDALVRRRHAGGAARRRRAGGGAPARPAAAAADPGREPQPSRAAWRGRSSRDGCGPGTRCACNRPGR